MAGSSPYIGNIEAWSKRNGNLLAAELALFDISRYKDEFHNLKDGFAHFIPIRLVTILEVYLRNVVKNLVNHGAPYFDRANPFLKNVKLDFEYISAIQGKRITVGDLVAHSISTNSFEQIFSILTTLLGDGLQNMLATVHSRHEVEIMGSPPRPIISDFSEMARTLSRLFEVRHVLVHEIPTEVPYEISELECFLSATHQFIEACDQVTSTALFGNYPLTQLAMNERARARSEDAAKALDELIDKVRNLPNVNDLALVASQAAWVSFAEKEAEFQASFFDGGSMRPLIYASTKEDCTKKRIAELNQLIEREQSL